jgi:hypothetical protein
MYTWLYISLKFSENFLVFFIYKICLGYIIKEIDLLIDSIILDATAKLNEYCYIVKQKSLN